MGDRGRTATVDLRRAELIVQAWSQTTAGFLIAGERWLRIPKDVDDLVLGTAVEEMLAAAEWDVPVPDRCTWNPPIYAALCVKTHGQYARGVRQVSVEREYGETVVQPHRNAGRRGFVPYPDDQVLLGASPDPASLGATVRASLQRALP